MLIYIIHYSFETTVLVMGDLTHAPYSYMPVAGRSSEALTIKIKYYTYTNNKDITKSVSIH
jgi:hypothetical protein